MSKSINTAEIIAILRTQENLTPEQELQLAELVAVHEAQRAEAQREAGAATAHFAAEATAAAVDAVASPLKGATRFLGSFLSSLVD